MDYITEFQLFEEQFSWSSFKSTFLASEFFLNNFDLSSGTSAHEFGLNLSRPGRIGQ